MHKTLQYFKTFISWIIICLIFGAIGYWIYHLLASPKKHLKPSNIQTVRLAPVTYHIIPQTVQAYGITVSPKSTVLKAQTSGTIATIQFRAGQNVKKGQVLFTLLSNNVSTQAKKLYAAMLSSKSFFERQKQSNKLLSGSVSAYDIQKSKLQYEQDLAAYAESNAVNFVKAPFDGVISKTNLAVGGYVNMGQALAHLIDPRSMQVEYQVPSQDGDKVKLNQHIKFFINDHSKPYDGIVSYISPLYNNKNYNLVLRANISNVSSLKPNLFGSVIEITDLHYKALAIPQLLVQADAQGFYVYTVDESRVTKNYIKTGSINKKGLIEIKSGIAPNALIISSNIEDLTVGQAVKVAGR